MKGLLVYATKGGDTKIVGEFIASLLGFDIKEAKDLNASDLDSYKNFIFAVSTHGDGQIHNNFDDKLALLNKTDFEGKTVALVGLGNAKNHSNDFCSGLSGFLPNLKKVKLVGATDADGYKFNFSRSFINGKFIGLVIDFKDDPNWKKRAQNWCEMVKNEFK